MYNIKSNLILVFLVLLTVPAITQKLNLEPESNPKGNKRPCEFSLFVGKSYLGPSKEIGAAVANSEIKGSPGNLTDPPGYELKTKFRPYSFEFTVNVNQRSGISVSRGRNDAFSISRDDVDSRVKCVLKSTSLDYVHSFGHNRHELSSGVSYVSLQMKSTINKAVVKGNHKAAKVGLNIGYSYHIIEERGFYLALTTKYNWASTAEVGPYKVYEPGGINKILGIPIASSPSRTMQFPAAKVDLDSFNIGFTMGFRFGEKHAPVVN